jgi:hypothetical protein
MDAVAALFYVAAYGTAIWLSNRIAKSKGREYGWVWGMALGWLGVLICACRSSVADQEFSKLEADVRRFELEKRRMELDSERQAWAEDWQSKQTG